MGKYGPSINISPDGEGHLIWTKIILVSGHSFLVIADAHSEPKVWRAFLNQRMVASTDFEEVPRLLKDLMGAAENIAAGGGLGIEEDACNSD